jgi:soluble lytic murein transglycosylase
MKRLILIFVILLAAAAGAYFANQYWLHRYDSLIAQQAAVYQVDPDLVWSIIYEETYFSPWKNGKDGETGLMQVMPATGREWATEKGAPEVERQIIANPSEALKDPQRNIDVGCWYLQKFNEQYHDIPDRETRMLAAYNAGPGRAAEWNRTTNGARPLTAEEFIARIDIPSTKAYVTSVFARYREVKSSKGTTSNSVGK